MCIRDSYCPGVEVSTNNDGSFPFPPVSWGSPYSFPFKDPLSFLSVGKAAEVTLPLIDYSVFPLPVSASGHFLQFLSDLICSEQLHLPLPLALLASLNVHRDISLPAGRNLHSPDY